MRKFIKRVCFVIPMGLANLTDDLVFILTLNYLQTMLGLRFSIWWFKKGFGQY